MGSGVTLPLMAPELKTEIHIVNLLPRNDCAITGLVPRIAQYISRKEMHGRENLGYPFQLGCVLQAIISLEVRKKKQVLPFHLQRRDEIYANGQISTDRLNPLQGFHLPPINVVISDESMSDNLEVGFTLRCFQRLSPAERCYPAVPLEG